MGVLYRFDDVAQMFRRVYNDSLFAYHGDSAAWSPWTNTVDLGPVEITHADVDVDNGLIVTHSVATVAEELVHGYMDMYSDTPVVSSIRSAGRAAYENAPLDSGATASDPERIFQEAVGEYAAYRIRIYLDTRNRLGSLRRRGTLTQDRFDSIRRSYLERMEKRGFGYEGSGDDAHFTSMAMPESMRQIIDSEILGGLISDDFDEVEAFQEFDPSRSRSTRQEESDSISPPRQEESDSGGG